MLAWWRLFTGRIERKTAIKDKQTYLLNPYGVFKNLSFDFTTILYALRAILGNKTMTL
jgi:hypothetical protein